MRTFIAYHNQQTMGYSCTDIPYPRVKTSKPINGLEGSAIWLIAGEGKRPKNFYLAAKFIVENCEFNKYPATKLPNEISGKGKLLGKRICLDGTPLLNQIKKQTANFVSGLCELRDSAIIADLEKLA